MKKNKKTLSPRQLYLRKIKLDKSKIVIIQIAVLVAFVGLWELSTFLGWVDSFFVSSPSRIIKTFADLWKQDIMKHIGITLLECVLGFLISTVVGVTVAVERNFPKSCRAILSGA